MLLTDHRFFGQYELLERIGWEEWLRSFGPES